MATPHASAPACELCGAHATRTWCDAEQLFCAPCGLYMAGTEHDRAEKARDQLQDAVGALLDADVSGGRIEALTRAFVDDDVPPPVLPKAAREGDPRPWTALLEPLSDA